MCFKVFHLKLQIDLVMKGSLTRVENILRESSQSEKSSAAQRKDKIWKESFLLFLRLLEIITAFFFYHLLFGKGRVMGSPSCVFLWIRVYFLPSQHMLLSALFF